ncbi:B-cell antigen receptor complex-associated protein alpha chain [Vanacampus margaritifer]
MAAVCSIFIITCVAVVSTGIKVDRPWLRVHLSQRAVLECCYRSGATSLQATWFMHDQPANGSAIPVPIRTSDRLSSDYRAHAGFTCGTLTFAEVKVADSGLYRCWFNDTGIFTPGTYLQVYEPLKKTINLSEKTKDSILMAEGILLLLCVLVPSATLLCKSKQLHALEQKKAKKEDENIYQGLDLSDCDKALSLYQELVAIAQEEVQLETP